MTLLLKLVLLVSAAVAALTLAIEDTDQSEKTGYAGGPEATPDKRPTPKPAFFSYLDQPLCNIARGVEALSLVPVAEACVVSTDPSSTQSYRYFIGPNGRVPLQVMVPPHPTPARRIIVALVGGPGGDAFHFSPPAEEPVSSFNSVYERLARSGDIVIFPAYAGTAERSFFPMSDLPLALRELRDLIRALRQGGGVPVAIHGISLGGYLSLKLTGEFHDIPFVLLNPLLGSPGEALAYTERQWTEAQIAAGYARRWLWKGEGQDTHPSEQAHVHYFTGFRRFFGSEMDEKAPDPLPAQSAPIVIIYSKHDERIGPGEVDRLRLHDCVRVLETGTRGHVILDREEKLIVVEALNSAFKNLHRPCGNR
jgi:esterase/lipase